MMKIKFIIRFSVCCCIILINHGCNKTEVITIEPETVPAVVTKSIDQINAGIYKSYSVKGSVLLEGGSPILSRGICWSTNQSPALSDNSVDSGTGNGEFYGVINGNNLKSETIYYVRAYAKNNAGIGYGNELSFTTPCNLVNQNAPTVITCKFPGNNSENQYLQVTLKWDVNAITSFKYDIIFGTKPEPDSLIAKDFSGSALEVKGLKLNTTYYWKVIGHDENAPCQNISSAVFSFKTARIISAPIVRTKAVKNFTANYLILLGELVSDGGMPLIDYGLVWGEFPDPDITGSRISRMNVKMNNYVVFSALVTNGFRANTRYYVKAYATNNIGTTYGEEIQFVTEIPGTNIISDKEGNIYRTVKLGTQIWMADNLNSAKFNDGSIIPTDWPTSYSDVSPASGDLYNDNSNSKIYGKLYNWYSVKTGKLCPSGWHVPSKTEFELLENYLINNGYNYDGSLTGNKIAKSLVVEGMWSGSNTPGSPGFPDYTEQINKSGFSALPSGSLNFNSMDINSYMFLGLFSSSWWSSTETDAASWNSAWRFNIEGSDVNSNLYNSSKKNGYSVRCIKD